MLLQKHMLLLSGMQMLQFDCKGPSRLLHPLSSPVKTRVPHIDRRGPWGCCIHQGSPVVRHIERSHGKQLQAYICLLQVGSHVVKDAASNFVAQPLQNYAQVTHAA